jgi:xanthine dehydrogenase YagS FAD-binding subunit
MKPFTYERARTPAEAAAAATRVQGARFIAGGTNLLDLMKLQIETPAHLIDVNDLALNRIEPTADGGLRIGALVRNTDLAADPTVRRDYGSCARAPRGRLRSVAQPGDHRGEPAAANPLPYFYDTNLPCNKRVPGSGCSALGGFSRQHAIVGVERCLHRHAPERHGDRDAGARRDGRDGPAAMVGRTIPIADFHRLPGNTPHIETSLEPGELITAVTLPQPAGG